MSFQNKLHEKAGKLGIELSAESLNQLYSYYLLLLEKNKVMNLTAITEEDEVILKHFVDSLSIVRLPGTEFLYKEEVPGEAGPRVIDIGTGAGFPGLVLKIAFPFIRMTLFDSLRKRLLFLDEVIESLDLKGIETVHGRAEDFGHKAGFRESYDLAVSRAVANMAVLSEYCLPFVKKDGCFAAYKSAGSDTEVNEAEGAITKLGGSIEKVSSFLLPDSDIGRSLFLIRKIRSTPHAYPRKAGTPAKEPLK